MQWTTYQERRRKMSYKVESAKYALNKYSDCGDYDTVRHLIAQADNLDDTAKKLLEYKHINHWSFNKIAIIIDYSKTHTRRLYAKALSDYYDFYSELKLTTYGKRVIKDEIRR